MANGHGGKRTPANPAPVSGPGALSKRTDGQAARYVPGLNYGEGEATYDMQTAAPLAQAQAPAPLRAAASAPLPVSPDLVPFDAPTQYPDEPVTAGNPLGPGPGPEALATGGQKSPQRDRLRAALPIMLKIADDPGTSQATRETIRYLRSIL